MTRLPRTPALDGIRGLAVAGVLLFHAGVGWLVGGHLGVTVFFALSGFLITSLLLSEVEQSGRVDLRGFWARRAKRLVPALPVALLLVAAVAAWTSDPAGHLLQDSVATMTWSANWWFLASGQSYADLFHDPSPLQHTWSLAVEEQYYLLFPLLLLLLVRRGRAAVGVGIAALLVLSVGVGAWLSLHGSTSARLHYGTDTRVAEILAGAGLAVLLQQGRGWRRLASPLWAVLGVAAAAFLAWSMVTVQDDGRYLQRGGWALTAVASCALLAAAVQPGPVATALSAWPLVRLGQLSYGAYLFHWPLYLLITKETAGVDGPLLLLTRLTAVLVLAEVSLRVLELPVRHSGLSLGGGLSAWALAGTAGVVAVGLGTGAIVLPSLPPATDLPVTQAQALPGTVQRPQQPVRALPQQPGQRRVVVPAPRAMAVRSAAPAPARRETRQALPPAFTADPDKYPVPPVPAAGPNQLRVLVVGDSLAANLAEGLLRWSHTRSDVVVYDLAVPGCPLSRGGERRFTDGRLFPVKKSCGWWADHGAQRWKAMQQFAPQVVVTEDGVNELFDRRLSSWGDWRSPGSSQFDDWLVGEYGSVVQSFGGASTLMLNTPCADWQRYWAFASVSDMDGRVAAVNADQGRVNGITRADLRGRICPGGQYSDTVEGQPDGRPDGLHLSPEASFALARDWLGPQVLLMHKSTGILGS